MTQSHSGLNNIVYFFHAQKSRIMKPRVGMVALFHFEVIDSYCLVIQSCIVSVCRITSWSKMAAPIPIFVITFQPAKCRKGGKGHVSVIFEGGLPEICHMTFPHSSQFSHVATAGCKEAWKRADWSARKGKMKELHREVGSKSASVQKVSFGA